MKRSQLSVKQIHRKMCDVRFYCSYFSNKEQNIHEHLKAKIENAEKS